MQSKHPWPVTMLLAMLCLATTAARSHAEDAPAPSSSPTPTVLAVPDSSNAWAVALENTRAAYQAAWSSRQSGQFDVAVSICDRALTRLSQMLALDPDMSVRRELTDLKSRIGGLRDA